MMGKEKEFLFLKIKFSNLAEKYDLNKKSLTLLIDLFHFSSLLNLTVNFNNREIACQNFCNHSNNPSS